MLRPYSDREPRLPARPRRREALRAAAGPRARGGRSGRGARRAPRTRGGARRHAATGPAGAAGASGGAAGRAPAPGGARARGRAGAVRGGRRAAASGPRGRRRGRCGPRDSAAGATGRVAAMGRGRRAPQGGTRSHPGPGRVGRPHHMSSGDDIQLVTFRVAGQDFAFNIFQVERILRYEAPAPLPKAPEFLEGVLQYQGTAIPLIDFRKRLSVPAPLRDDTRTIILDWDGGKLGVVVDAVTEVMQVAATDVTQPHSIVRGLAAEYITGLVVKDKRTIVVLNTGKLLASKEKIALQAAVKTTAEAKV